MIRKILVLLFGMATAASYSVSASADTGERWPRWYIGLNSTFAAHPDSDASTGGSFSFNGGYGFSAALGYLPPGGGFLGNTRFEGEFLREHNDIDSVSFAGTTVPASGSMVSTAYMFNAYYDFLKGQKFMPYFGAGLGIADVRLKSIGLDEKDQAFAYQFMAGIGYTPETIPMTQFNLGYRYFSTENPSYSAGIGDVDNTVHNLEAGVKLKF